MLCKVKSFDITCYFQKPNFLNTSVSCTRVSVPPLETHNSTHNVKDSNFLDKQKQKHHDDNVGHREFRRIYRRKSNSSVILEKDSNFRKNPHGKCSDLDEKQLRSENKVNCDVGFRDKGRSLWFKDVHTKCPTKWASYGGCVGAVLQSLEDVEDLDEAFRGWEKTGISSKEMSLILKEQVRWERALEIFEWFKRKGCFELNVIHYNIMLRILGKARRWGELEVLWDEMREKGIKPINSTYGTLIDVYRKGGKKAEAVRWFERMLEQGVVVDEVTTGIVVQMYKKAGEFDKAEEFFKKWSSGELDQRKIVMEGPECSCAAANVSSRASLSLSPYAYNTMIDTYGKSGRLEEMSQTFWKMLVDRVVPDTITFNSMIHTYCNHDKLNEVNELVLKMKELKCAPNTRTYNILISFYVKCDDINQALKCFSMMKEARIEPDSVSYETLLDAIVLRGMIAEAELLVSEMDIKGLEIDEYRQSDIMRMYINAGMLDKSWLWFERFHLQGNMTSECYAANIDAYGERGHVEAAEKVFYCCRERKLMGVIEVNVMIKAYGVSQKCDKACQLFDSMCDLGVVPDRCSYNSLVHILVAADLPHIARRYLLKMLEVGLVNDCSQFCALISSFAKLGQLESAKSLYNEMIGYDVQPDIIVYSVLINAFAECGNVTEATEYIDAMRKAGLSLNDVVCKCLIKLYTKAGLLEEAEDTCRELRSLGKDSDVYSSNCLIDLYTRRSMVKEAEEIYENLQEKGKANEFSYAMMLSMYKRIGRIGKAMKIAAIMQELGLLTQLLSYNSILSLFAFDGRLKEAIRLFKEMMRCKIEPDDSTFKSLGVVLEKFGVPKRAVAKLDVQRMRDPVNGMEAWTSALDSLFTYDNDGDYDNS